MSARNTNPILDILDDWKLPRLETRAQVIERVGLSPDPFFRDQTLCLTEALTLPGAMAPWSASSFERIPLQFPISRFSELVWFEDNAHTNVRRTADHIAERLGHASIRQHWNILVGTWRCGLAEISLMAFPGEWQSGNLQNDAHDREPRLRTACRVNVTTGLMPALSDEEQAWVTSLQPIRFKGSVGNATAARAGSLAPFETAMEYARDASCLPPSVQGSFRLSAGNEALIAVSSQLFVIPRSHLLRFEVIRLTPAKGDGGSTLLAHCHTEAPGADSHKVFLAQSPKPDGLNELATDLGARLDCAVEIGKYFPDA